MATKSDQVSWWVPASLGVLALLLCAGLLYRHHTAKVDREWTGATIVHYSNEWASASAKLVEQKKVNVRLERNLDDQVVTLQTVSNKLSLVQQEAVAVQAAAKEQSDSNGNQLDQRGTRIAALESERNGMEKTMTRLSGSVSKLEANIADVERKLQASQGDRRLLEAELKRLRAEKADLELRFNDLAVVREQIRKLRNELSLSRRLAWLRREFTGGFQNREKLLQNLASATPAPASYNLDVELHRNGTAAAVTADSGSSH